LPLAIKKLFLTLFIYLIAASLAMAAQFAPADFILKDQDGNPLDLTKYRGQVLLITASGKDGIDQNKAWGKPVQEKYQDQVVILGGAYLKGIPFFVKGMAIQMVKDHSFGKKVLMDWDGEFFEYYGLDTKGTNVLVLDKKGVCQAIERGAVNEAGLKKIFAAINFSLNR
jgi:hypothetical protein